MKADKSKLTLAMARACMNSADLAKAAEMPLQTVNRVMLGRSVRPATLVYGSAEGFGPMLNTRHPKKCPPVMKKTAPSAANTESGKQTPESS